MRMCAFLTMRFYLPQQVPAESSAAKAGVRPTTRNSKGTLVLGDVITGLAGKPVTSYPDLYAALDGRRVGDSVELDLLREAQPMTVTVILADRAENVKSYAPEDLKSYAPDGWQG